MGSLRFIRGRQEGNDRNGQARRPHDPLQRYHAGAGNGSSFHGRRDDDCGRNNRLPESSRGSGSMMKRRLFTPGPTPVPEKVMMRMAEPIIHHRSVEFKEIFARVNENLKYLFQTSQPVLTLTCSGTGGMEAVFVSLFSPGETIISVNAGKFGERWVKMPRVFGLNVVEMKLEWGEAPEAGPVLKLLQEHPEAKAVFLTHSETSSGAASDVKALASVIKKNSSALVCVDGITAIGAHELRFDDW